MNGNRVLKAVVDSLVESSADVYEVMRQKKDSSGDWVVVVKRNGKRDEGKTYYTNDKQDAINTAKAMRKELGLTVEAFEPDEEFNAREKAARKEVERNVRAAYSKLSEVVAELRIVSKMLKNAKEFAGRVSGDASYGPLREDIQAVWDAEGEVIDAFVQDGGINELADQMYAQTFGTKVLGHSRR